MKAGGPRTCVKDKVSKFTKMAINIKAIGLKIGDMEMEN